MYSDIGKKIKGSAIIVFILEAVISVIAGIILANEADESFGVIAIVGPLLAWIGSWLLYGFGELIDKVFDIEKNTRGMSVKPKTPTSSEADRLNQLEALRSKGLISEEEYQNAVAKNR